MNKSEINRIIKQAKKLSKTKTEDELFEIIGKETTPFEDKFKPGDIICSDRFHNGLCMVVDKLELSSIKNEFRYRCVDLVKEEQLWGAYESDNYMFNFSYDWRIATDDDIVKYLARHVRVNLGKVGEHFVAEYREDGIMLEDTMFTDKYIYLEIEELADLKRIIDERVG